MADSTSAASAAAKSTAATSASTPKAEVLVTYKSGGVNIRRVLSKKDWASMDIDMPGQTVWEKRNNWTLTATDWPAAAIKWLESSNEFTVERPSA